MKKNFSRREFLQTSGGVAGALAAANTIRLDAEGIPPARPGPASDRSYRVKWDWSQ